MATKIDDFLKTATDEQKGLLVKLVETHEEEKKLVNKVNNIFGATKSGVYSSDGGYSLTLCEDEDDAMVISGKDRQELKTVQAQIANYLKQAVELGMKDLGIIKRNYKDYVGEDMPVN